MDKDLEQLIISRIQTVLADAKIEINSDDGVHFYALVRSSAFVGMKKLDQHRLVMNALSDIFASNAMHALGLKTEAL